MQPTWAAPALCPGEGGHAFLGLGRPDTLENQFIRHRVEEALSHNVVMSVARAAHRGAYRYMGAVVTKLKAGAPDALNRVVNGALHLTTGLAGHLCHTAA